MQQVYLTLAAILAVASSALATPLPDFALHDENAKSERYLHDISPRQYQGRISVVYFIGSH